MPHGERNGTLVRGADGVLYDVSARASDPIPAIPDEVSAGGTEPSERDLAGHSDHLAARVLIDPGDHAAASIRIDPGDHEASRIVIDPGDHAAARIQIDPSG